MPSTLNSLNTIRIDGVKVSVNPARYTKAGQNTSSEHIPSREAHTSINQRKNNFMYAAENQRKNNFMYAAENQYRAPIKLAGNKSYAEVLSDCQATGNNATHNKSISIPYKSAWFPETCKRRAVICESHDLNSLVNAKKVITAEGITAREMVYLGGLHSLLTFDGTYSAREFIQNSRPSWNPIFRTVTLWEGQDIPYQRIACINIHGVPVLARDETTYNMIGGKFGRVLIPSEFSWTDEDVSYAKVHILVNGGARIDEKMSLHWRNTQYTIWVVEDQTPWTPTIEDPPEDMEEDEECLNFNGDGYDDHPSSPVLNGNDINEGGRQVNSGCDEGDRQENEIRGGKNEPPITTGEAEKSPESKHASISGDNEEGLLNIDEDVNSRENVTSRLSPRKPANNFPHDLVEESGTGPLLDKGQEIRVLHSTYSNSNKDQSDDNYSSVNNELKYGPAHNPMGENEILSEEPNSPTSLPDLNKTFSDYEVPLSPLRLRRKKKADKKRRIQAIQFQMMMSRGGTKAAMWNSLTKSFSASLRSQSRSNSSSSSSQVRKRNQNKEIENTKEIGNLLGFDMDASTEALKDLVNELGAQHVYP